MFSEVLAGLDFLVIQKHSGTPVEDRNKKILGHVRQIATEEFSRLESALALNMIAK